MSDRWGAIRWLAAETRTAARPYATGEGVGLAEAALLRRDLDLYRCTPKDPLLCGAKGVYDHDYVAYDRTLAAAQAAWVLAHELGHAVVHGDRCQCAEADLSEDPVTSRLPYGAGAVDVYNPRQQRELEANVFAAAFLLPGDELRTRFLAGASFDELAAHFGVSPTATLNALANTLLGLHPPPPTDGTGASAPTPLDPSQTAAAGIERGPVLVSAGPGTGKTRTLVARIGHLLGRGVAPNQVLAVAYSNRAAAELRDRLTQTVPRQAHALTVCTFHAFCLEVLRRHHDLVGLPADFAVIDQVDATVLLERNLRRLPLDHYLNLANPSPALKALVNAIGRAKDELVGPGRYAELAEAARVAAGEDGPAQERAAKWAEVAAVYAAYEPLLLEHGVIDFGGLVMQAVALLRDRPDILVQLQREYSHVLVDEYQDMNRASCRLLQLLTGDGLGLWVVGDLRQAIFRFRGASPANIARFPQDFPGGRTIDLGVNYRSDPRLVALLRAAGAAMSADGAPLPTWDAFWPEEAPPRVWVAEAGDGAAEGAGIAAEILRRLRAGRPFKDQAVLVRTHRQAEEIVAALDRAQVPALYLGDLFAREEVRDLLALAALVAEGGGSGLVRVGAMPEHLLPRADRVRLIRFARERNQPFPGALALGAEAGLPPASVAVADELLAGLRGIGWQANPWQFFARYLFGHGALVRRLLAEPGAGAAQRLMALGQLLAVARAFGERPKGDTPDARHALRAFLIHVRRLVASDDNGVRLPATAGGLDAVTVLTVHAAKGLEFPVVYVTNLADRRFPFQPPPNTAPPPPGLIEGETEDALLEEARLFFVAISRARNELVLSRAERYGKIAYPPSPLLSLIESFFAGEPAERLRWESEPCPKVPAPGEAVDLDRALDVAEVELYLRCPRRYEYRYVLGLREQDELLGYKRFQECVYRVLARLRERHRDGALPDDEGARQMLAEEWEHGGPRGHAHEGAFRRLGDALIARFRQSLVGRATGRPWRDQLDVTLGGVTVRVRLDASELAADGTVRITRVRAGRVRDEDRKAPRLALVRAEAGKLVGGRSKVAIELEYPTTGDTVAVKDAKGWEDKRVGGLAAAVEGILAGQYPPEPESDRDCATCPYWMVCPA